MEIRLAVEDAHERLHALLDQILGTPAREEAHRRRLLARLRRTLERYDRAEEATLSSVLDDGGEQAGLAASGRRERRAILRLLQELEAGRADPAGVFSELQERLELHFHEVETRHLRKLHRRVSHRDARRLGDRFLALLTSGETDTGTKPA